MTINEKLKKLRAIMLSENADALVIPSSDPHQSEYVAAHWQERAWISGFTGSAGVVVVTKDHAGLWTDSRYFLQAEIELKKSEFVLHKMINQFAAPHIDYLAENLPAGATVVFNGYMFSKSSLDSIKKTLSAHHINVSYRLDLISDIWQDRPPLSDATVRYHEEKFAGKNILEKFAEIRSVLANIDFHLITTLDDLAWTFNIRSKDVEFNPVAIAYAIISKTEAFIFIEEKRLSTEVKKQFKNACIKILPYNDIIPFLNNLSENKKILVDPTLCSQTIYEAINAEIIPAASIPKNLKAIKNNTEIAHIRTVMKKDCAALANCFYWLEQALHENQPITEADVAAKLTEFRSDQKYYQGESFGAIVGYKENGAIIHYHPDPKTSQTIYPEGILLVDSGGQYCDGTTDITRTFTLSPPTPEQKKSYTLILKGMIALSKATFPEGTTGAQLDTLARQFLWSAGLNYGHGTGHGVGFYLNVHEPPQGFAPFHSERGRTVLLPGMLTSNEPGYYKENEYGMRIENLILSKKSASDGYLEFETVTLYPFEHALIDKSLITKEEVGWINAYHKSVYTSVSRLLKNEVKDWFKHKCRKV